MTILSYYTQNRALRWWLISTHAGALLLTAYLLVYGFNLEPCPLCLLQQWVWWPIVIIAPISALLNSKRCYAVSAISIAIFLLLGLSIASRHIWLLVFADPSTQTCGLPLSFMIEHLPWLDTITLILQGSAECHKVTWTFLGLPLPAWSWLNYAGGLCILYIDIHLNRSQVPK